MEKNLDPQLQNTNAPTKKSFCSRDLDLSPVLLPLRLPLLLCQATQRVKVVAAPGPFACAIFATDVESVCPLTRLCSPVTNQDACCDHSPRRFKDFEPHFTISS